MRPTRHGECWTPMLLQASHSATRTWTPVLLQARSSTTRASWIANVLMGVLQSHTAGVQEGRVAGPYYGK